MAVPIIIDCDPGHDDAIAIFLALASPEVDLLGITTVAGNTTLENATLNALRVLELAGRPDIRVAAGAAGPLSRELVTAAHVHGESGLAGPQLAEPTIRPVDTPAVEFLESLIAGSTKPVTLIPVGPLTNIAMLLEQRPAVRDGIERIVLMGGSIGLGNITPAAEFNIYVDPEAADRVFSSGLDVTMIGLDVTHQALLTPEDGRLMSGTGPVGQFVSELLEYFTRRYLEIFGIPAAPVHDAAAVAHVVIPGMIEVADVNIEVEVESGLNRGRTVVDRYGVTSRAVNAHVGIDIDSKAFASLITTRLSSFPT